MINGEMNVKPIPSFKVFLLGATCSGLCWALFSRDWACSVLGMAIFAGVLCVVVSKLIFFGLRRWGEVVSDRRTTGVKSAAAAVLIIVVVFLIWAKLHARWLGGNTFVEAFGIAPSADVTDLRAERHYAGGPGDMVCLLRFRATKGAIDEIVARRGLVRNAELMHAYARHEISWDQFWERGIGAQPGAFNRSWVKVRPMDRPEIYSTSLTAARGLIRTVEVIWDGASGETFAVYSAG